MTVAVLESYGLRHIGEPEDLTAVQVVAHGPDGQAGTIVGHKRNWKPAEVKQGPNLRWQKCPIIPPSETEPRYKQAYIGIDPERPLPKADELMRDEQVASHPTIMHDGSVWLLPIANELPRVFAMDTETGKLRAREIQAKHRRVWDVMQRWLEHHGDENAAVYRRYDEMIAVCFGTNYRVGLVELSMLQVLGEDVVDKTLWALLDIAGEEALKKSPGLDIGVISDGVEQSTQDSPATTPQA